MLVKLKATAFAWSFICTISMPINFTHGRDRSLQVQLFDQVWPF